MRTTERLLLLASLGGVAYFVLRKLQDGFFGEYTPISVTPEPEENARIDDNRVVSPGVIQPGQPFRIKAALEKEIGDDPLPLKVEAYLTRVHRGGANDRHIMCWKKAPGDFFEPEGGPKSITIPAHHREGYTDKIVFSDGAAGTHIAFVVTFRDGDDQQHALRGVALVPVGRGT